MEAQRVWIRRLEIWRPGALLAQSGAAERSGGAERRSCGVLAVVGVYPAQSSSRSSWRRTLLEGRFTPDKVMSDEPKFTHQGQLLGTRRFPLAT